MKKIIKKLYFSLKFLFKKCDRIVLLTFLYTVSIILIRYNIFNIMIMIFYVFQIKYNMFNLI